MTSAINIADRQLKGPKALTIASIRNRKVFKVLEFENEHKMLKTAINYDIKLTSLKLGAHDILLNQELLKQTLVRNAYLNGLLGTINNAGSIHCEKLLTLGELQLYSEILQRITGTESTFELSETNRMRLIGKHYDVLSVIGEKTSNK